MEVPGNVPPVMAREQSCQIQQSSRISVKNVMGLEIVLSVMEQGKINWFPPLEVG